MSNLDEALERFHKVALEYGGGLANHGPMGAEALESLGHHALIPAFVNICVPRLPVAEPGACLNDDEVRGALGDFERGADWVATFEARLVGGDWREVLAAEVPSLLPGVFAGAGHGMLRTAHAVRALEREDSPLRRRELARGLAYWASRYQELPGHVAGRGDDDGEASVALGAVLADWPLLGEAADRGGFFFDVARQLDDVAAFAEAVERVVPPGPRAMDDFLDTLCLHAAGVYVTSPHARVAFVHGLTVPSAMRTLASYLSEEAASLGAVYAVQGVGAFTTLFGRADSQPEHDDEVVRVTEDWDEIRYHAACSIEEHSIKMVDACWREDRRNPHPTFRHAAADAALKIVSRGQATVC